MDSWIHSCFLACFSEVTACICQNIALTAQTNFIKIVQCQKVSNLSFVSILAEKSVF